MIHTIYENSESDLKDGGRIMTNLDCNVVGCSYNNNNSCRRDNITIGGSQAQKSSETVCKSFSPKGTNTLVNACGGAKKQTNVACDAVNCKFNQSKECSAEHIGVAGRHAVTNGETECGSFEQR